MGEVVKSVKKANKIVGVEPSIEFHSTEEEYQKKDSITNLRTYQAPIVITEKVASLFKKDKGKKSKKIAKKIASTANPVVSTRKLRNK